MKTNIRRIGNSSGMILPAAILKKLNLSEGDEIDISESGNKIVITAKKIKPKYTLKELLAQCDLNAPMPDAVKEWDDIQTEGRESL